MTAARLTSVLVAVVILGGCSVAKLATGALSSSLAQGAAVFAADEDPEFVRDALPFALKTYEMLLETTPEDVDLLLATCSGFTQYAKAFLEDDAFYAAEVDYGRGRALYQRARAMYLRARGYCLRALEIDTGVQLADLTRDADEALQEVSRDQVPILYWTGAAWGSAIAIGLDQPELVVDLPVVRAIFERGVHLNVDYDRGGFEEAWMALEALPEILGGSIDRARVHFDNAVAASNGASLSPYVAWAVSVSVPNQDRDEFILMLDAALDIDLDDAPHIRLANEVAQRKAEYLRQHAEEYFID